MIVEFAQKGCSSYNASVTVTDTELSTDCSTQALRDWLHGPNSVPLSSRRSFQYHIWLSCLLNYYENNVLKKSISIMQRARVAVEEPVARVVGDHGAGEGGPRQQGELVHVRPA